MCNSYLYARMNIKTISNIFNERWVVILVDACCVVGKYVEKNTICYVSGWRDNEKELKKERKTTTAKRQNCFERAV